jgi:hypothetical protein
MNKISIEVKPPHDHMSGSYWASVKPNLEKWFDENNIEYALILTNSGNIFNNKWCFDFIKVDDLLFKLTWA